MKTNVLKIIYGNGLVKYNMAFYGKFLKLENGCITYRFFASNFTFFYI